MNEWNRASSSHATAPPAIADPRHAGNVGEVYDKGNEGNDTSALEQAVKLPQSWRCFR